MLNYVEFQRFWAFEINLTGQKLREKSNCFKIHINACGAATHHRVVCLIWRRSFVSYIIVNVISTYRTQRTARNAQQATHSTQRTARNASHETYRTCLICALQFYYINASQIYALLTMHYTQPISRNAPHCPNTHRTHYLWSMMTNKWIYWSHCWFHN